MLFFANPKSEYIHLKKKIDIKIKKILNSNSYILGKEVIKNKYCHIIKNIGDWYLYKIII